MTPWSTPPYSPKRLDSLGGGDNLAVQGEYSGAGYSTVDSRGLGAPVSQEQESGDGPVGNAPAELQESGDGPEQDAPAELQESGDGPAQPWQELEIGNPGTYFGVGIDKQRILSRAIGSGLVNPTIDHPWGDDDWVVWVDKPLRDFSEVRFCPSNEKFFVYGL